MEQYTSKLDRLIRWNSFLTHHSVNALELIHFVTEGKLSIESVEGRRLEQNVVDNTNLYKNKVFALFEVSSFPLSSIITLR